MTETNDRSLPESGTTDSSSKTSPGDRDERPRHSGSGRRRFNKNRPHGHRPGGRRFGGRRPERPDARITKMIHDAEKQLLDSYAPIQLESLNAFERKQIHQHFERRKSEYETKTYRRDEEYVLWIFPVENLKKYAASKATEALESGEEIALPPMSNYERFLVHSVLKEFDNVETVSVGEGPERHIEIHPKKFGRSLKKIVKKIKLF